MTPPINIAIIAGQLVVGGAERQLYLWLANLDRTKFNPVVITLHPGHGDYWEKPIEDLGIQLFRVYQNKHRLSRLLQIIKILRPVKPQLIHGWHMFSGAYAALAARLLGAKSIAGIRSSFLAIKGSPETSLVRWFCDALVVNSKTAAESYRAEYKAFHQKIFLVKNAVVPGFEQRSSVRSNLVNRFAIPSDKIWLASIGRMDPLKYFDSLIKACALLEKQQISFHLILVGDGPEKSKLESMVKDLGIADYLTFTGEVPFASDWMQAFDIFCFPSLAEGMPNVILEAAAAGLPIIAWDLPFNREILPDPNMACLLSPGDYTALAEKLKELIQDGSQRASLGKLASAFILTNHDLAKYVTDLTAVYQEILNLNPPLKSL